MAKRLVDNKMRMEVWSGTSQDATLWDVASTRLAGVPEMYADGDVYMMRAFGKWLEVGLIICFCPTSVLLRLEVIKCPTMGDDLAWCGGTLTHSGTDAQTNVRFRPTLKIHVCISSEGGRVAHDVGGLIFYSG